MPSTSLRALTVLACLAAAPVLAQSASPAGPPAKAAPAARDGAKAPPLDLNSATVEELSRLKGIGEARSAAIVKGRPYTGKDDLVQRKILPESVYAGIKDQIVARQK